VAVGDYNPWLQRVWCPWGRGLCAAGDRTLSVSAQRGAAGPAVQQAEL